jgi:hypothetical protein
MRRQLAHRASARHATHAPLQRCHAVRRAGARIVAQRQRVQHDATQLLRQTCGRERVAKQRVSVCKRRPGRLRLLRCGFERAHERALVARGELARREDVGA